ncbi:MAG TPA: sulfatase/phosphatase domain-containing protein, partial [Isosphaeraceae bacterium]|nr:sulfatase/phosphatase domain-containing protein [Isosphaeraceae bacterium]
WHMGDSDEPQKGFDHWVAFRGQGQYYPGGRGTSRTVPQTSAEGYNMNGRRVPQKGYITDELTDFALDWLGKQKGDTPFFLYLSHKAVHSDFVPADRHRGRYAEAKVELPAPPDQKAGDRPRWLIDQQNSRHGSGFAYNLPDFDLAVYYRRYCEAILPLDESVGRLLDHLDKAGILDNTLVVYMGDNGFQFGEQGLIDKRTAYEASIRIPLLMRWPQGLPAGRSVTEEVANIDIAPTLLAVAGVEVPRSFDGRNALPLARGETPERPWRKALLYEYFWERNYPQTPTMHAVHSGCWKYIRYHGIWDTDELFDLEADPTESMNLIARPEHQETVARLHRMLFDLLDETAGHAIPLAPDRGATFPWRKPGGPAPGTFPQRFFVPKDPSEVPPWARGIDTGGAP